MIIVRLTGGLGNQMFQYAAGRRLAHKHESDLKLDLSAYDNQSHVDTPRSYELDCYNLSSKIATRDEIPQQHGGRLRRLVARALPSAPHLSTINEDGYSVNKSVIDASDNSYLIGYWQSEQYFSDIAEIIRNEFTVKEPPLGKNARLLKEIRAVTSVSLHVRRGDYIANAHANKFHGTSPLDYYYRAIRELTKKVKNPTFFVFSDDPEWCKENLKLDYETVYVEHNAPDKGYEDMRLMSACNHHIIANSSFSWWGAWLNPNPSKIVIAPAKWFNDPTVDTRDVYAEGWIRL